MKIMTTTNARKQIGAIVDHVSNTGEVMGIGRRDGVEVVLIPFPKEYNKEMNDITNINSYSRSFDFLEEEPDLYSENDVIKKYE